MGVEAIYRRDPVAMTRDLLGSETEKARRAEAGLRARLLRDDGSALVQEQIRLLFKDVEVRRRIEPFADLADSQGLTRRIVREMARPVYAVAPTRTIDPPEAQEPFAALVRETRLNARMAMALEAMLNAADACLLDRFVPSLGRVVTSVLEAHEFTVIPHPDDPAVALAYIYDKVGRDGETWHVYWDDSLRFQLDGGGRVQPFELGADPFVRHAGLLPFTPLHLGERSSSFFEPLMGKSVSRADLQCRLLNVLALRLLKSQGYSQRWLKGDVRGMPRGQVLDPENAVYLGDGADAAAGTFADTGDAKNYLALMSAIKTDVAANCGISRARLNQDSAQGSSDVGLLEVRSELVRTMTEVEQAHFEILKAVSVEHPDWPLPPDCEMSIDFGEWELRTDRKSELEVFETEERLGLANVLDEIARKSPEADTEEKQKAEFTRNVEVRSWKVEQLRALNMKADGSTEMPGQDARQNGALGPAVRDGRMTRDEARDRAEGSPDPDPDAEA